ncbi:MAG: phosphatidate cytidylyltransferase [Chloroflexota bacterium]
MLRSRILTAAIGLPAIGLAIGLGPGPFAIFLAVVSVSCTIELANLLSDSSRSVLTYVTVIWTVAVATRHLTPVDDLDALLITLPLLLVLVLLLPVGRQRRPFSSWAWSVVCVFYVGWLMSAWGAMYGLEAGKALVVLGLVTTFAYDTSAYLVGNAFGNHKLAPSLSSGKTIEGVAGGMSGAVLVAIIAHIALSRIVSALPFGLGATILIAVLLSLAAQAGDLVESALKRSVHAKDAGSVLPGHGGMLDRFDSVLFTGTVLYYVSLWLTA